MCEILGQDHLTELVYVMNYKSLTIIQPAYDLNCLWVIYHVIKFHQECRFINRVLLRASLVVLAALAKILVILEIELVGVMLVGIGANLCVLEFHI